MNQLVIEGSKLPSLVEKWDGPPSVALVPCANSMEVAHLFNHSLMLIPREYVKRASKTVRTISLRSGLTIKFVYDHPVYGWRSR